jgi:hypothetical protein
VAEYKPSPPKSTVIDGLQKLRVYAPSQPRAVRLVPLKGATLVLSNKPSRIRGRSQLPRKSITILVVTARGTLDVEEALTLNAASGLQTRTMPRNLVRIIFKTDAAQGTSAVIKIRQGNMLHEVPIDPRDDVVADVIDP